MTSKKRQQFDLQLSTDDDLLGKIYPYLDEFQDHIRISLNKFSKVTGRDRLQVLEIGCGGGLTTTKILKSFAQIELTCLDINGQAIEFAKKRMDRHFPNSKAKFVHVDAVEFLEKCPEGKFDAIVSAWTIHNIRRKKRRILLENAYRSIANEGIFVNADKYARNASLHNKDLYNFTNRLISVLQSENDHEVLKYFLLHGIEDEHPERIMIKKNEIRDMQNIGYYDVSSLFRREMECVVVAYKNTLKKGRNHE